MPLIGIDLGTTFSAVAYLDPSGTPTTIPNSEGELTTPSVILFEPTGETIVGREARRAALTEPQHVADYVKRHMGEPFYPRVLDGQRRSPTALSALILAKLKKDAEQRVGKIDGAVITVPAYFDEARRQATAAAGTMAGLKVIDIINEPTAAALAYAYQTLSAGGGGGASVAELHKRLAEKTRKVLVYDLGGGTFDVTILAITGGDLKVIATAGDVQLGGRDWDDRLFDFAADAFVHAHGEDPRDDPATVQNLMLAVEEAKKILSQRRQTRIVVNHSGRSLTVEMTRQEFENMTADLLFRTESRLLRVLKQAALNWEQIDQVLAVGGSTRMPQVLEMLRRVTGKEANCTLSPDEAVAQGAAIHAAVCAVGAANSATASPAPTASTAAPTPPVVPSKGAVPPPASSAPLISSAPATTHPPAAAKAATIKVVPLTPPQSANPEALPVIQAEPMPGLLTYFKQRALELLGSIRTTNVNAHSLGVIVTQSDGSERVSIVLPNHTPLPASVTKTFGTIRLNQKDVTVRVVEGESRKPEECLPVGACQIKQLPGNLPKNSPIDVTFTYDNSCRLRVRARDVTSGAWASVTIQRSAAVILPAASADAAAGKPSGADHG